MNYFVIVAGSHDAKLFGPLTGLEAFKLHARLEAENSHQANPPKLWIATPSLPDENSQ